MKRKLVSTTALAFALFAAATLFAAETTTVHKTPEENCKARTEREHLSREKLGAFVKSRVERHAKASASNSGTRTPSQTWSG